MVFKFGEHSIDLGEIDFEAKDFKMGNDTSYAEKFIKKYKHSKNYREQLLPLKLQCLQNIKDFIGDDYYIYTDLLAGLGISAKIFQGDKNMFNDFSEDCWEILCKNFVGDCRITKYDMFNAEIADSDFIFADFNNFTTKRYLTLYKPVVDKIFNSAQKYVLINDCSVFYLKYGKKSYETYAKLLEKARIDDIKEFYWAQKDFYKKQYPEWDLTMIEAFKDTSFLFFDKGGDSDDLLQKLFIKINKKEDIKIKTELI